MIGWMDFNNTFWSSAAGNPGICHFLLHKPPSGSLIRFFQDKKNDPILYQKMNLLKIQSGSFNSFHFESSQSTKKVQVSLDNSFMSENRWTSHGGTGQRAASIYMQM